MNIVELCKAVEDVEKRIAAYRSNHIDHEAPEHMYEELRHAKERMLKLVRVAKEDAIENDSGQKPVFTRRMAFHVPKRIGDPIMSKTKTKTKTKTTKPKTSKPSKPKTSKPATSGEKTARKSKVATPEAVRDMLAKLSPVPSFSDTQIARYCASPGRKHSDPAKLAERLASL